MYDLVCDCHQLLLCLKLPCWWNQWD